MNKLSLFFKYLAISFVAANIPWVGWGVIFGWPAILMISISLAILDGITSTFNNSEMFLFTLFVGFVANVISDIGLSLLIHENINFGIVAMASPSIVAGALLVVLFHKPKNICVCPVHKD